MIRTVLDWIFPPYCLACRELCSTKYLCPDCWLLCELPDPVGRCRHCFEELDQRGNLCAQCRHKAFLWAIRAFVFDPAAPARYLDLEATHAFAAFAFLQWIQLEWPLPDAVIPMPDSHGIAKALSLLLDRPLIRALHSDCTYRDDSLEEDLLLLLVDISQPLETLKKVELALSEAFPKRIYLLSLLPYVTHPP